MTNVRVPATWIAQGYHPPVCARHGQPASSTKVRTFYTRNSPWLLLLALASILIALIVILAIRKSVKGPLPMCSRCGQERKRYLAAATGSWVLFFVLSWFALEGGQLAVLWGWLGAVALVAGVVLLMVKDRTRVTGTLDKEQIWVELRGVDASFARLMNQALQQLPAPQASYGYGGPGDGYGPSGPAPDTTPGYSADYIAQQ